MGLLDRWFKPRPEPRPVPSEPSPEPRPRAATRKLSDKELATQRGEPWVSVVSMELDPDNLHQGSFELDWNEKFIANLVRAGYQAEPNESEDVIVDRWFQNVCRHVVLETWEQEQAMNPQRFTKSVNLGGGFTEVS